MHSLGRLLLRFILVPLGYCVGVTAGALVILFGSFAPAGVAAALGSDVETIAVFGLMFAGPVLLVMLLSVMWLPGAIGILLAEAFALRSWIFHAGNGALTAWLGWHLFGYLDESGIAVNQPLAVIAAGLAGGLAYWLIAGWSAGFWRPLLAPSREPLAQPRPAANPLR